MKRLLLLEDDKSLVTGLAFALRRQGYELDTARTLEQAGELWAQNPYDLLILDVCLPDGSGFDFCRQVRKSSNVPILFLTASTKRRTLSWDWTSAGTTI